MFVTSDTQFAVTTTDVSNNEWQFSTLPENLWMLLLALRVFARVWKRKKRSSFILRLNQTFQDV